MPIKTKDVEECYEMFAKEMECAGYTKILAPCGDVLPKVQYIIQEPAA